MTQPPTPRGPLGQLIEDAKVESQLDWRAIEAGSRIPLSTIQAWVSGRSSDPPLRGVLHLARFLGISPEDLAEAALSGYVAPLARNGSTHETIGSDTVESVARLLPSAPPRRGGPRRR